MVNLDTQWMGRTAAGTGTVWSRVKVFSESSQAPAFAELSVFLNIFLQLFFLPEAELSLIPFLLVGSWK